MHTVREWGGVDYSLISGCCYSKLIASPFACIPLAAKPTIAGTAPSSADAADVHFIYACSKKV